MRTAELPIDNVTCGPWLTAFAEVGLLHSVVVTQKDG